MRREQVREQRRAQQVSAGQRHDDPFPALGVRGPRGEPRTEVAGLRDIEAVLGLRERAEEDDCDAERQQRDGQLERGEGGEQAFHRKGAVHGPRGWTRAEREDSDRFSRDVGNGSGPPARCRPLRSPCPHRTPATGGTAVPRRADRFVSIGGLRGPAQYFTDFTKRMKFSRSVATSAAGPASL